MENALVKVGDKEYQVDGDGASKVNQALAPMITQRDELAKQYEIVIAAGIAPENIEHAKVLGKALQQNRTGIEKIRKSQKDVALRYGQFVDAVAKAETLPIVQMEEEVKKITQHHENAEKARKLKLHEDRKAMALRLDPEDAELDYSRMTEAQWESTYENLVWLKEKRDEKAAKAEEERVAAEKAEAERVEAERVERERIEAENAKLKKEAEEREAKEVKEQAKREKVEAERVAKELADQKDRDYAQATRDAEIEKERKAMADKLADEKAERDAASKLRDEEDAKRVKKEQEERAAIQKKLDDAEAEKQRIITEAAEKEQADAAEKAATEKREADTKHRKRINNASVDELVSWGASAEAAKTIVTALAKGESKSMSIIY